MILWKAWFSKLEESPFSSDEKAQRHFMAQIIVIMQVVILLALPLIYIANNWLAFFWSTISFLILHFLGSQILTTKYSALYSSFLIIGNLITFSFVLLSPQHYHVTNVIMMWSAFPLFLIPRENLERIIFFIVFSIFNFGISSYTAGKFAFLEETTPYLVDLLLEYLISLTNFAFILFVVYKIITNHRNALLELAKTNKELIDSDNNFQNTLAQMSSLMATLEENKMRMDLALEVSKMGIWEYDILVQEMHWDNRMHELFGLSVSEFDNQFSSFKKRILEEDRPEFLSKLNTAISEEGELNTVFRILRPDGEIRYINLISKLTFNEESQLTEMMGICWDLTKERQQEKLLNDTQKLLEKTSEIASTGGWEHDIENNIFRWSNQIKKILDVPTDFEPEPNTLFSFVHPNYRKTMLRLMDNAINMGEGWDTIIQLTNYIGENKWVRSIANPQIENNKVVKIQGAYQDITSQKNSETEKEFFFNMSSEMFAITSLSSLKFSYLSNSWSQILGYSEEQLKEGSFIDYVHPEDQLPFQECLASITKDNHFQEYTARMKTFSNEYFWIKWNMNFHEESELLYCVCRNVSSQKSYEEELILTRESALEAAHSKSIFLSTMSHEIRTPMNAVIGMTQLLLDEGPREDQLENLDILSFSANNLLALINDILDFNKIESGQITFEAFPFQIERLIGNIHSTFKKRCADQNTLLAAQLDSLLPETLIGDITRITQILNNIIGNAIKFTENGLVTLEISQLSRNNDDLMIQFLIRDTGIGIAKENLGKIFENFSQADATITRKFGGTGLGLSICKKLCELQGGKIWVESEYGVGSQFYIQLPFKSGNAIDENINETLDAVDFSILENKKVLVAEDNKINFTLVKKILNKKGVQPINAINGKDALIEVQKNHYDIILMDVQMPVMDGYEATKAIRSLGGKYATIPIIALTADVLEDVKLKVNTCGMDDFVSKPLNPKTLFNKMTHYLKLSLKN